MPQLESNGISACVTDPPYGLGFMGKEWDNFDPQRIDIDVRKAQERYRKRGVKYGADIRSRAASAGIYDLSLEGNRAYQAWMTEWASALFQCLKPGAMVLSFGGTRTFHRLTCGLEDAGFEIRDCLMWVYGSGFPKSHDISKAIDKVKGAEREIIGPRITGDGHIQNRIRGRNTFGTFTIAQDGIDMETIPTTPEAQLWNGYGTALKPAWEPIILAMKPLDGTFAENALKHEVAGLNIDGCRIETDDKLGGGMLKGTNPVSEGWDRPWRHDLKVARRKAQETSEKVAYAEAKGRWPANLLLDEESARMLDEQSGSLKAGGNISGLEPSCPAKNVYGKYDRHVWQAHGDSGGASRFFYVAKASRSERGDINHPTLKPLKLMEYLIKLVMPPKDGIIIDPFMGSGTTLLACKQLGIKCIGIETSEEYCQMAVSRLKQMVMNLTNGLEM